MSRKSHFGKPCRAPKSYDMTYFNFLHILVISYDYFQILQWCVIKRNAHDMMQIECFKYIYYSNFSSVDIWICDICFHLHVTMVTVANE